LLICDWRFRVWVRLSLVGSLQSYICLSSPQQADKIYPPIHWQR